MKAYTVEVTAQNKPKNCQGEDPVTYVPLPTNFIKMIRYNDPKKKIRWIKTLKKLINTIMDSGTLKNKEQAKPNDVVVSIT
jgi:hypothetical protein